MFRLKKHIQDLKVNGITYLPKEYSNKKISYYKNKFEKILRDFKKKKIPLNPECQMIRNPYRHDLELSNLIYNKKVDQILKNLIGKDYILVNSTIINRRLSKDVTNHGTNMGDKWHTDSHYLNGKRMEKGITYIVITLFDDFTKDNGGTMYIPKSHNKRSNFENRWSMFSYYGPWFIKPYFRFPEMLGKNFGKKCNKELKRLFHYNSTPPLNEEESLYTLRY